VQERNRLNLLYAYLSDSQRIHDFFIEDNTNSTLHVHVLTMLILALVLILLSLIGPCKGFKSYLYLPTQNTHENASNNIGGFTGTRAIQIAELSTHLQLRSSWSSLCSTLFDDNDLDWDADDDGDDFDIQLNSIFESTQEPNKGNEDNSQNVEPVDLNELDDTDETYYEQLFLQQSLGVEQKRKAEQISGRSTQQENTSELLGELQDYEKMVVLRKEWKEKVSQMRNESIQTRKLRRKSIKRNNLEERASFLALRALRMQTMPLEESSPNKVFPSPIPTLSISSSRNYKRKEDEMDKREVLLERKLYGKRFKDAKKVYIRLLEFVEEKRSESTAMASELIADRLEKEFSFSLSLSGDTNDGTLVEESRTKYADEVTKMNESQQMLMTTLVHLSVNGKSALDSKSDTLNLGAIDTEDLCSILKIRGNAKRRGRLPKGRTKVLEYLLESFSRPLF
jgi:hypothetical protein